MQDKYLQSPYTQLLLEFIIANGLRMKVCMCAAAASAASSFAGKQDPSGSLPQRLQRALMTWQHPSTAMPAAAVAAVAASKQGAGFLDERRELWRESFRSLYIAVQSGHCHCFYFMTPQVKSWLGWPSLLLKWHQAAAALHNQACTLV